MADSADIRRRPRRTRFASRRSSDAPSLDGATLESALNKHAADGWRYSALVTGAGSQLFLLLERDNQAERVG